MLQNQERKCARVFVSADRKKKNRNAGQTFVFIIKVKETRYFHLRVIAFWIYLNCIKCGRSIRIKELLLDFAQVQAILAYLRVSIFNYFLFLPVFLYIAVVLDFVASNWLCALSEIPISMLRSQKRLNTCC